MSVSVAMLPLHASARPVQESSRRRYTASAVERDAGDDPLFFDVNNGATPARQNLTVAVAQTASNETTTPEDMAAHMIQFVVQAAARGARVVVFPEMAVRTSCLHA